MKTTINLNEQEITISAKLSQQGVNFPNCEPSTETSHNKFHITLTDKETKNRIGFNFYDSQQNWKNNIHILPVSALIKAVDCFLSDATSGTDTLENFCGEMGYSEDSIRAKRIYGLCRVSSEKAERFFKSDIWECLDAIQKINN